MDSATTFIALISYGLLFGILSTIVAKGRNRSPGKWFFIGFIFGIFGWITALAMPVAEPKIPKKDPYEKKYGYKRLKY